MKYSLILAFIFSCISISIFAQIQDADGDNHLLQEGRVIQKELDFRTDLQTAPVGDLIEGDFMGQATYGLASGWLFLPNRHSDRVSFYYDEDYDGGWAVCEEPVAVAAVGAFLMVACYSSNNIIFYNSIGHPVATFDTDGKPCNMVMSPDTSLILVATEGGPALLININNGQTVEIPNFHAEIEKFSFITSNTRNTLYWSNYGIAPDNSYVINASGNEGAKIYDTQTGELISTIPEIPHSPLIQLSGDGSTWICMGLGNDGIISRVNAIDGTLIDQFSLTGHSVWSTYGGPAVNMTGDRVLVPIFPDNLALVRFDQDDFITIPIGTTPNWLGQSYDHQYGVVGSYYLSIVDFETGAITSQLTGRPIQNGAVSPDEYKFVGYDPLRQEVLHFYDFSDPNNLQYISTHNAGTALEGDAPYSIQIISDEKAIALNTLSGTLSVFNYQTQTLLAIIPLGSHETYNAAVSSDGKYAYVPRRLENDVIVVDLESYEIVAEVSSGGEKPDQIYILPDEQYAYVMNAGGSDKIGVIEIDGANSSFSSSFTIGNTGISWANYGIRSDLAFTPDGQYGILAASFDDKVQIIDLNSHQIIEEIIVDGFPLQLAVGEIDGIGTAIGVVLRNSNELQILTNPGPNSSITDPFEIGGAPTSIAYGIADDGSEQTGFYITSADDRSVQFFSLEALDITYTKDYGPDHQPIKVIYSEEAGPFILARSENTDLNPFLEFSGDSRVEFEGIARADIKIQDPIPSVALVPDIHNDQILVFFTDIVGSKVESVSLSGAARFTVFPQPASAEIWFENQTNPEVDKTAGWVRVYDNMGQICYRQEVSDLTKFSINMSGHTASTYFYQIGNQAGVLASGQLLLAK